MIAPRGLRRSGVGSSIAGVALFTGAAAWAGVTAAAAHSSSVPIAGSILVGGMTIAICWWFAARWPLVVPAALVAASVAIVVADVEGTFSSGPLQGPFGYANATAAFFAQSIVAALMLVAGTRTQVVRLLAIVASLLFAATVVVSSSWTVAVVLPVVVGASLVSKRVRDGRAAVLVSGMLFVAILLATVVLGARGVQDGPIDRAVGATLSDERITLWHEALAIAADEPFLGVGPGGFASTSPTASADRDLRWAHHEFLQAGAETGLIGFALAVGLFLWGFVALWQGSPTGITVLAAASLALLGIHASVDYVLHFVPVTVAGAALLGAGLGAQPSEAGTSAAEVAVLPVREEV